MHKLITANGYTSRVQEVVKVNDSCGSQRGRLKCKKIESMSGRSDHRHRISASEILWFLCFGESEHPSSSIQHHRLRNSPLKFVHVEPQDIVTLVLSWHMNAAGTSSCKFFGGLQALGPDFLIAPIGKLLSFNYENKNLRKKLNGEEDPPRSDKKDIEELIKKTKLLNLQPPNVFNV
ncbi:hypothetical protein Bca52824_047653 [Brassica carinata]|uniref:Uncharacterized protein n=1 Tax=Brassica carinata TaxID=52824 RepID=A0A8X7RF70_BRACI|nr:hypothetical protein Bca52824_047653 [Brassica carinata]